MQKKKKKAVSSFSPEWDSPVFFQRLGNYGSGSPNILKLVSWKNTGSLPSLDLEWQVGRFSELAHQSKKQVATVTRKNFARFHLLHKLHLFPDQKRLWIVTQALETSWVDYCNVLFVGLPLKITQKLGWSRTWHHKQWFPCITSAPWGLQMQYKLLATTFKPFHGIKPIKETVLHNSNRKPTIYLFPAAESREPMIWSRIIRKERRDKFFSLPRTIEYIIIWWGTIHAI